jgi:hypothetical protein
MVFTCKLTLFKRRNQIFDNKRIYFRFQSVSRATPGFEEETIDSREHTNQRNIIAAVSANDRRQIIILIH